MSPKSKLLFAITLVLISVKSFSQILVMPLDGDANDYSGHNNNGVIQGNVTQANNRLGVANKAYHFPGTQSDFIYIPTNITTYDFNIVESDSFSISLWMQPENNNLNQYIFAKRDTFWSASQTSDFDITMGQGMISSGFGVSYSADYNDYNATNPQNWYHIVLNYSNGVSQLYVNDTLRSSNTNSPIDSSASTVIIGRYFKGEVDDINFFERTLTASEVDNLYRYGSMTGIKSLGEEKSNVIVYPNPSNDFVTIKNISGNQLQIELIDMLGNKKISQQIDTDLQLDIRNNSKGVYMLRVFNLKESSVYRIVIN